MRRSVNFLLAAVLLVPCTPVMLLFAVMIWIETPGKSFFAQTRVCRHRNTFICYKLRTMVMGTPSTDTHNVPKAAVTRMGRFLRATKLDEMPQLWNIIRGEMDFVGPRPCLPNQIALITEREKRGVFSVRPGITGLAQVEGIDMSTPVLLAETDARYIETRSFLGDLALLARTVMGGGQGDRPAKI